jgi:hypothetical protein
MVKDYLEDHRIWGLVIVTRLVYGFFTECKLSVYICDICYLNTTEMEKFSEKEGLMEWYS